MKRLKNYKKIKTKQYLILLLMTFFMGCSDFDTIGNSKDFDLFGNSKDSKETKLRHYDDNGLNLPPLVEFIVDYENPVSVRYSNHIKKLCNYTKLPFSTMNLKSWNAKYTISESTRVLIILEPRKMKSETISKVLEFVSEGGTLFIPFSCDDKRFGFLTGMKENADYDTDINAIGIKLKTSFIPGLDGKTFRSELGHFGMSGHNYKETVKVFATANNDEKFPLIMENVVGKGKVIHFNTTFELEKIDRSLFFSAIIKGLEGIPYPIANTSTIFLDDFPSPLYDAKQEPIKSEMNLTIAQFVETVWWPDMKNLAKRHKISYTAIPAFDYNNKIKPPFLFNQWDAKKTKKNSQIEPISSWLMKDCIKNGHELGFHGYNHVSLLKREWKNPEFIETSLEGVQKKWKVSNFQDFPVSYVPPSNYIDDVGLKHLKKGMPSINFNCSLYLGELKDGGNREFDFDPYHFDMFDYPRIASGYYYGEAEDYALHGLYMYTGIWNHFIHPDDVYQIKSPFNKSMGNFDERNSRGLGWRKTKGGGNGMYQEFDNILSNFEKLYPQVRFLNAGQGAPITLDWRASKYNHSTENGKYKVNKLNPEKSLTNKQYWFMYGSNENAEKIEAQLKKESSTFSKTKFVDGFLYTIFTDSPVLELDDLRPEKKEQDYFVVAGEYSNYLEKVKLFEKGEVWVDNSEELNRIEMATLKQTMLSQAKIDSTVWNKYARIKSWENKGDEVWKMLEKHCIKYPKPENILYSIELDKVIGYTNELDHQKWIEAQMLVRPNDKELLNSYVANFYSEENQEKIKNALKALMNIDTGPESIKKYIQHLLWYAPDEALVEIEKIEPNAEYSDLADNIVWLYANNNKLQKAYDWSFFATDIDFPSKMEWLFGLGKFDLLQDEYKKYFLSNPNDYKVNALMSGYYHEMGKFKEAWILADNLPDSIEKAGLRKMLNTDVVFEDELLQQYLLQYHPNLFYDVTRATLNRSTRLRYGSYVESENELQTNQKINSAAKTVNSYNFLDKKQNVHRIAATYTELYPIRFFDTVINPFRIKNLKTSNFKLSNEELTKKINVFRNLVGIEYRFKNPFSFDKIQYWARARYERDNLDKNYFQFGAGVNKSKNKNFSSAEINVFPVETAPGHEKDIYHLKGNLYHSRFFLTHFNASLAVESNYYTKSNAQDGYFLKESYDVTSTLRLSWDTVEDKKMKFIPFLESAFLNGNNDLSFGFPYWTLKKRFYGGGGLGFNYGLETDKFYTRLEASYFLDDFAKQFQRYSGTLSYRFLPYTSVIGRFEYFVLEKFYSNTLQIGLRHTFKDKAKFTPK